MFAETKRKGCRSLKCSKYTLEVETQRQHGVDYKYTRLKGKD
jgi:hypothetical protein